MDLTEFQDGVLPEGFETNDAIALSDDATWRELLMAEFKPADIVRVKNIDNEDFTWQFMPEENELSVMNGDRTGYITYRKKPEVYMIKAGDEMPLVGANAYLMVEALAKKCIIKWAEANDKKSNLMIQLTTKQEYIGKIVQGVENLLSMAQKATKPIEVEDSLEEDLGLNEPVVRRGRPKTA